MAFGSPTIAEEGDSFTATFYLEPLVWSAQFVLGLCLMVFASGSLKGFGGAVAILDGVLLLRRTQRVRFDAAARKLTVEKGWGLRKKTYDMNLLRRFYLKSVDKSGRYCVLVLEQSGRYEDADFGPFRSDGEIRSLMDILGAGLGRDIPEVKANGSPY